MFAIKEQVIIASAFKKNKAKSLLTEAHNITMFLAAKNDYNLRIKLFFKY